MAPRSAVAGAGRVGATDALQSGRGNDGGVRLRTSIFGVAAALLALALASGCKDDAAITDDSLVDRDEVAPTVTFLRPADGDILTGRVEVEIDAEDAFEVASLDLRVDGDSVTLSTQAPPWIWMWDSSTATPGVHTLAAHVWDAAGNEGVATIEVTVERDVCPAGDCPPTEVFWVQPSPGPVTGSLVLEAAAIDDRGVAEIRYFADGAEIGRASGPFDIVWDSGTVTEGPHVLEAVATDTSGQELDTALEITVDRSPPEVDLARPDDVDVVHDVLAFDAALSDASGVARVEIRVAEETLAELTDVGDAVSGMVSTAQLPAGAYTLQAVAWDRVGLEGEDDRAFVIDRPPTVEIVSPTEGEVVTNLVTVRVEAADDVEIQDVLLFDGERELGVVVDGELEWDPGFGREQRVLSARATDLRGQSVEFGVTVQLDRAFPLDVLVCDDGCVPLEDGQVLQDTAILRPVTDPEVATLVGATVHVADETLASSAEAPFDLVVDTTALDDGEYTLVLTATADGRDVTAARDIRVNNCDRDNDQALAEACGGGDCDDLEPGYRPGAPDFVGDDLDQNCDGLDGEDGDGDDHASIDSGGGDCDDLDEEVYPCPSDRLGTCSDRVTDDANCGGCGMACELGLSCVDAECLCDREECVEGSPSDYAFDVPATFFHTIVIEEDDSIGLDVDDDGEIDNRFGPLLQALGEVFGGDGNATIAFLIGRGDLRMGAAWPTLEGPVEMQDDVTLDFFDLDDVDGNPSTRDHYRVDPASFLPGTATPRSRFARGTIAQSRYDAGPAPVFRMIFPLGNVLLPLVVTRAQVSGVVGQDENGLTFTQATVGGAIRYEDLIDALNAYLRSPICSCLQLDEPLITEGRLCTGEFETESCNSPTQEVCGAIAANCGLLVPILRGQTDIDLDDDRRADSYSVYIHLAGSGTHLDGLAEE
jgi:hypothetical protein